MNRVPREKSGRHSNLIYLVLKPLKKKTVRHSVIVHYFQDVVHYFSVIFHYFQGVFHYFSLMVQCRYMCFIIFQCFFSVLEMFFIIFHYLLGRFFAIYMHILHICSTTYMEDTGRSKIR